MFQSQQVFSPCFSEIDCCIITYSSVDNKTFLHLFCSLPVILGVIKFIKITVAYSLGKGDDWNLHGSNSQQTPVWQVNKQINKTWWAPLLFAKGKIDKLCHQKHFFSTTNPPVTLICVILLFVTGVVYCREQLPPPAESSPLMWWL